jgi:hypothetical protein
VIPCRRAEIKFVHQPTTDDISILILPSPRDEILLAPAPGERYALANRTFASAMNISTYASWILGPVLQLTLLAFMVRRKLRLTFPLFFSYILFQLLKSVCLGLVYRFLPGDYFDAYWTGNAVSVFLALLVMDEIWRQLFGNYQGFQKLGSLLFRWACVLLFLIAVVVATSTQHTNADRVIAAVFTFDRTMRLMQCGLVFLLVVLSRFVRSIWRRQVFGIALGFGIFASVELILVSILSRYGASHIASISLIKSMAYNVVTLFWIGYVRLASPAPRAVVTQPQFEDWNIALLGSSGAAVDGSFLTMVESAVDKVMAKSSDASRSKSA